MLPSKPTEITPESQPLEIKDVMIWHSNTSSTLEGPALHEAARQLAEQTGKLVIALGPGETMKSLSEAEMKTAGWMPVSEHEAAMHQVRRFREYERWERVYEAAQALVNLKPDAFPSRCWREVVALRAALEWTDDNEED